MAWITEHLEPGDLQADAFALAVHHADGTVTLYGPDAALGKATDGGEKVAAEMGREVG